MGNTFSDYVSLQRESPTPKKTPSTTGPEIIDISGFRYNLGHKSADLTISEPRNNSYFNLSELGLFDFWILPRTKYHISPLPVLYLVLYLSAVHVTITHNKESQTHLRQHTALVVCETELCPHTNATAAPPPPSKPPQAHHSSSTAAAAQQQSQQQRRW